MTYKDEDILRKIQELRESIEAREKEIQQMRDHLKSLELAHSIMMEAPSNDRQTDLIDSQRFRTMGLQDACLEILNGAEKPLFREDMAKILLSGGYVTRSNRFRDVVGTTLNNLSKANRIWRVAIQDRVAYRGITESGSESEEPEQE